MHKHGPADTTENAGDTILLVGNPNVGKSVFFGLFTGRYVVVSNYPGTTVEIARGTGRIGGHAINVIDTPGANSFSPNSEDERVARDVVIKSGGGTIIQVADAKNLRRALLLTAQLAELDVPMVLALNMADEARDRGIHVDAIALGKELGVPAVPTVAIERRGFHLLTSSLKDAAVAQFQPDYGEVIEAAVDDITALLPPDRPGRRGIALMLLANDPELENDIAAVAEPDFRERLEAIRSRAASQLRRSPALTIQHRRAEQADAVVERVIKSPGQAQAVAGWERFVCFALLAPAFFYLVGWRLAAFVFYDLLGEGLVGTLFGGAPRFGALGLLGAAVATHACALLCAALFGGSAWRREHRRGDSLTLALARLSTHPVGGFFLLVFVLWIVYVVVGVLGAGECVDFFESTVFGTFNEKTGQYEGLINGPLSRGLGSLLSPDGLIYAFFFDQEAGLISTGLTYAVAIVFPIVTLFFLLFSLMEDSGYLPRLSLLADRIFKRVGLSGKAVLPMVLGLGCGTMATMTTRILETRKQRLIAILLLALAVPCSAQLGVISAVLAKVSMAGLLVYVATIIAVLFIIGRLAAMVLPGKGADLLLEVPPFRWPRPRNAIVKTYHRVKWFMKEAVPMFLLGTVFLFVIKKIGLLSWIESAARPVVTGVLGLPVETTKGFILGFLRRDYATVVIFEQFKVGDLRAGQALVALVVITLFVPCLAHFFVCVKELGWRKAILLDIVVLVLAVAAGALVRGLLALTGLQIALPVPPG